MGELVRLKSISKSFGGVLALNNVNFDIQAGEVHALLGENGAGKSTLMRVRGGEMQPDSGDINVGGMLVTHSDPRAAHALGIAVTHQELALALDLTVAGNTFLGELPGIISHARLRARAKELIGRLGFDIDPSRVVSSLSVAHRQVVEIAKAISQDIKFIVFDDPTSVLSAQDAERLHRIIGGFRAKGVGIVYISYRLDEVFRIAGRMMVGRPLAAMFSARDKSNIGAEVLKVEKLNSGRRVRDVSFAVKAGEIVGLGGLVGSGRTEVARLIFGADIPDSGTITLKGKTIRPRSPKDTVAAGIGLVPEDRKLHGVVLDKPIRTNATMARMSAVVNPLGFLKTGHERRLVTELGRSLRLKVSSVDAPVASLSGGNQPKVVLAKWFHAGGDMIILDEPTRGVDAGAKTEICSVATIEGNWGPFVLLETGGDAMRWARRAFHEKSLSYQDIAAKAAEAPAGSDALFFLPYLTGERLGDHRNARAQFFGIGAGHGLAHLHRAVLEGVGFAAARHLRIMEKAAGRKLERVVASGGGARTTLWLKIKASIYGIPVVAPKEPECGIIGCAAMAVTATGRFAKPQDAVDSFVKYETEVQPDPAWSETYARMQPVFDRLYHHSQALYGDLDVLSS